MPRTPSRWPRKRTVAVNGSPASPESNQCVTARASSSEAFSAVRAEGNAVRRCAASCVEAAATCTPRLVLDRATRSRCPPFAWTLLHKCSRFQVGAPRRSHPTAGVYGFAPVGCASLSSLLSVSSVVSGGSSLANLRTTRPSASSRSTRSYCVVCGCGPCNRHRSLSRPHRKGAGRALEQAIYAAPVRRGPGERLADVARHMIRGSVDEVGCTDPPWGRLRRDSRA